METAGKRGLSEAALKNIAVLTMTLDHVTAFILKEYLVSQGILNLYSNDWYTIGRVIGRIAFVLYAFMIAEGAYRTKSRWKYAARLLALAVISIIPHSYVNAKKLFNPSDMNIFFLLFLGLVTIYAFDWLRDHIGNKWASVFLRLLAAAASCAISMIFHFEYGMMGILLILVFYLFRYDYPKLFLFGFLVMSVGYMAHVVISHGAVTWINSHSHNLLMSLLNTDKIQIFGILAFPLIYFYNGEKGRQLPKAFYYLFYPVHLGIIALIICA